MLQRKNGSGPAPLQMSRTCFEGWCVSLQIEGVGDSARKNAIGCGGRLAGTKEIATQNLTRVVEPVKEYRRMSGAPQQQCSRH